ncbi:MAG: PQQ-like beta-propeller repeat protein [Verrucomicrobia bacterium]|nr:PQQ-like beta-propeller repeat protein [Verrucomicrobiota bacterium]
MKRACTSPLISTAFFLFTCLVAVSVASAASDWPQWRGPSRNGILPDSPPLADQWPAKGLAKLWDSEVIPSDDDGGHGSIVAAGGRVYAAIVWHTDVPTETRGIDDLVMRQLGYQSVASWPKETVEKMEKDRLSLDRNVIGAEFDKFLADWLEKNLDAKKRQTSAGYVRNRFDRRGDAIPLEVYDKLLTVSKKRFPNEATLVAWLNEQDFSEKLKKEIMAAVPPTMKVAEDVVVCLDLATGKTLWKCKSPGEATGRMASSTPCVAGGRVYALGSTHFYAVDAGTGTLVWSAPLPSKGPASSPMVVDGVLVINAGKLAAFDAATGKPLWTQPKAGGGNSSPVAWKSGDKTVVICNGRGVLAGVDLESGEVLWTTPGGGDCTPTIVNDALAVQTNNPKVGILAGRLSATGFFQLWSIPYDPLRSQSCPLILGDHVYLMDDNIHFCFELATGRELWREKVTSSTISSPVCADGKVFLVTGSGSKVVMLKPSPEKRIEMGKANTKALWCPSPAIADGKLLLRGRKGITCYSLTAGATAASAP